MDRTPPDPASSGMRRVLDFFGLSRSMFGLLSMVILVGMGERLAERFLPLYLIALGAGALAVGGLNALDNFLSALYSFFGGYLAERFGLKRSLFIFNVIAIAGFLIVIFIPAWPAVFVGAVFFISWTAISLPASMGLVARVLKRDKRTMGVTMHSLVRRIPMALGPIVGGVFIELWGVTLGVRLAFVAATAMALVAIVLQEVMIEEDRAPGAIPGKATLHPWHMLGLMSGNLRRLLVADILVRFCEQIPYAFVILWATQRIAHPISALQFGVLTAIEMMTAMLIYVPVAWLADRSRKKPFVVATFGFFTAFPLVLLFSQSFPMLVFAFIIRGLKEFGEPTRKALIMDLAPEDRKAGMFGTYYLARDVIVSLAAFAGGPLWLLGPRVNLLVAFGFGALGTLWFAWMGRDEGASVVRLTA